MKTSLEHKTIRPGSLADYSFYYSNRQLAHVESPATRPPLPLKRFAQMILIIALCIGLGGSVYALSHNHAPDVASWSGSRAASTPAASNKGQLSGVGANHCAGNKVNQFIKVSITQRHLWACQAGHQLYDSAVITGMEKHASTATPLGTYKIYAKQSNLTLTGSDETGSWNDPVSYWMPFLDNQYGTYGFHDATWRSAGEFGNIDAATSDNASHGCVELPIAASTWLYNWAATGTTVSTQS